MGLEMVLFRNSKLTYCKDKQNNERIYQKDI